MKPDARTTEPETQAEPQTPAGPRPPAEPQIPSDVLCIVGPTASGKTEVGILVAQRLGGEIISADSMLVYRHMDIGTAKPDEVQRSLVKHHLIDVVDPGEEFTVAQYKLMAEDAARRIASRGRLPILVGGTGLYVWAVVDGLQFPEGEPDWEYRRELQKLVQEKGPAYLHARLMQIDPRAAERIHPNDSRRIIRALEIFEQTGKPISELQRKLPGGNVKGRVVLCGLTLDRAELYERINRRVDSMIESGLVEEVKSLVEAGFESAITAMQALGYKEIVSYLNGETTLREAIELIKKRTRHYAKRQYTWFRRDRRITWLDWSDYPTPSEMADKIAALYASPDEAAGRRSRI